MEQLRYIVEDSTIAEILGVQNFSTKESAVLELVKNAYDAQATEMRIIISPSEITITDNGIGMNREMIHTHWMHVGKSPKGYIENGRVMAGSKGVGRFALARLGAYVIVDSHHEGDLAIRWITDWNTSTVESLDAKISLGTTIRISALRDRWTEKGIEQLVGFLSRSYADTEMHLEVVFNGATHVIGNYLSGLELGQDYVWRLELNYDSVTQSLHYSFYGDEFVDGAQQFCHQNIRFTSDNISIINEFSPQVQVGEIDGLSEELTELGNFSATLYFQNKPSRVDVEKFMYKDHNGLSRKESGVVLYRNAFSIAGYEGKRDWLELGKRSRKSPAAASHPTGAWRVRENQLLGRVDIDKKNNRYLTDLSNRQGMEENAYYKHFIEIITVGLSYFERYRQDLIRSIDKKNKAEPAKEATPILDQVLANPKKLDTLGAAEQQALTKEIKEERKQVEQQRTAWAETEQRYKYDIRLLNILATLGLRSSSMAHEMNNDRSSIVTNCENIINALKHFGYWEELLSPAKTRVQYRNIPKLLEVAQKVEAKMVSFMDVMLTDIEKQKFQAQNNNVFSILQDIRSKWIADYAKLNINIDGDKTVQFYIAEDILIAIFDNLILNSVQQNDRRNQINIGIGFAIEDGKLHITYADDGVGLVAKYRANPMRILEVHETSRTNGHGLGMWIVNNSIQYTGGNVVTITGENGFTFKFTLGSVE